MSGNSLVKSSGTPGWNAGAISVQTLSGDGQVDFIATETTTYRMVGLGNGDTNQDYPDIQYAIWLSSSGTSAVYESGVFKFGYVPYAGGDKFTVGVESGVVKYRRNGVLFYTSLIAPTYPLVVDTSLYDPGATVTNARVVGFVGPSIP